MKKVESSLFTDTDTDTVLSPAHYQVGGIEVIDIFKAKFTPEEFKGVCKANILKYILRADYKNGLVDYKKALVYLEWLIEALEQNTNQ